jgi:membrane protein
VSQPLRLGSGLRAVGEEKRARGRHRDIRPPEALARFDFAALARDIVWRCMDDDVLGLSAELAYRFFLAIFPFAIFLTALGGFIAANLNVENPAGQIVQSLGGLLPEGADTIVKSQLQAIIDFRDPSLLSLSALLALFFATGGMNAVIKAMNRVYDVPESRVIWRRYLVALLLTIIGGAGMISAFVLYGPVRYLAPQVAHALGLGSQTALVINVISIGAALLLVVVAATLVYRLAPNLRLSVTSLLPGAVLFAVVWLVATLGLNIYVTNFGSYANTYGALAGVAILLLFFYVSALLFLVAGQFNAALHAMTAPRDLRERREESEERAREQQPPEHEPAEQQPPEDAPPEREPPEQQPPEREPAEQQPPEHAPK